MTKGLEEKLRTAESFMETARFLDLTAGKLAIEKSAAAAKARIEKQRYQAKTVCHFLYAVVFELAIKIIWTIDKGEDCRPTHDILSLYKELSSEKQLRIRSLYDSQVSSLNVEGTQQDGSSISVENLVDLQTLEEALESNKDTITNFKYDGQFHGKSSAIDGVIWKGETVWIMPERFVVFPEELLAYAKENLEFYSESMARTCS